MIRGTANKLVEAKMDLTHTQQELDFRDELRGHGVAAAELVALSS